MSNGAIKNFQFKIFEISPGLKISRFIPSKQNRPFPEYLCLHVQSKLPFSWLFPFVLSKKNTRSDMENRISSERIVPDAVRESPDL